MIDKPDNKIDNAISFGVFFRLAPSTRLIILSRYVSPGSDVIEIIILLGIYYDKFYDYKIVEEYEKTIVETPGFKNWYKFNYPMEKYLSQH